MATTNASAKAEDLKARGNEKYKADQLEEAIKLYQEAAALQPAVPVYLSNLSAAQLENGQYVEALGSCDAALALMSSETANTALKNKLLSRRARLLLLLNADDPSYHGPALEASRSFKVQAAAIDRRESSRKDEHLVNVRLTSMPRYRNAMRNVMEYFTVGQDEANSIFRVQYGDIEVYPEGEEHPYAKRFHMHLPWDGTPFDFSALFCGIADARHLYASLADFGVDLDGFKRMEKTSPVKVHFCLVDIHPTVLARDLVILVALDRLSQTPGDQRSKSTDPRALELLLMLHYTFWGTTMPPAAVKTLDAIVEEVYDIVSKAAKASEALNLAWIYIEPETVKAMEPSLKWWTTEGKSAKTFQAIIPNRIMSDPGSDHEQVLTPEQRLTLEERKAEIRRQQIDNLEKTRDDPRVIAEAASRGISVDEIIEERVAAVEDDDGMLEMLEGCPDNAVLERVSFKELKVMVPPAHAKEPEVLETIFKQIRENDLTNMVHPEDLSVVHKALGKRWRANYTLLDKNWIEACSGRANHPHCPFGGVRELLSHSLQAFRPRGKSGCLYDWSAAFFGLVADGIQRAQEVGQLKIEFVQGDGFAIMDRIRMGTLTREEGFPVLFDRIHGCNVPDYIGGHLANFTSAVPLSKSHEAAYYTSCCLLNSGCWEGGFLNGNTFGKNLDSALWTYAATTRANVSSAYAAELCCTPSYMGNYHTFRRLPTVPNRLSKRDLNRLAYAVFLTTVLPAKYAKFNAPTTIREPQNVHAFFRLLEYLKNLGYPTHMLADIVESILENKVTSGVVPHDVTPIPLATQHQPLGVICTTPFVAEFEVASALWEPRLFPICSTALPAVAEIVRYAVRIRIDQFAIPGSHAIPWNHLVLALVFGLPKDLDAGMVDPRKRIVGTKDCKTSIELVSTFEYESGVATFLLSRSRAESFKQLGYEVAVVNTSLWRVQSCKVKCTSMKAVGDVDWEDEDKKLGLSQERGLTRSETDGWMQDMMGGSMGLGGRMGLGGAPSDVIQQMMAAMMGGGF